MQRLRTDISWKVACGLALTDEGFHPTVLTLWRNRLAPDDRMRGLNSLWVRLR